jgi:hypothetical protein
MSTTTYRIVIRGARPGHAPERVARRLAELFQLAPEQTAAMLSERALVIKRGVALDQAARYQASLEKRGCACLIEPEDRKPVEPGPIIVTSSVSIDEARTRSRLRTAAALAAAMVVGIVLFALVRGLAILSQ